LVHENEATAIPFNCDDFAENLVGLDLGIQTDVPHSKPPFGSSTSRRLRDFRLAT
jgi:hypothetical protein